ncbi:MAG: deoxyribodipyrimidine photolyase, partial [Hyphomicrobiaceae bacterium]
MNQLSFLDETPPLKTIEWQPTRSAGQERLESFLPRAGKAYAQARNFDFGPEDRSNISCLSPWLRHRLVCEQEVVTATLARQGFSSSDKFIQEVFWRAYFKGWLEQRPGVWSSYRRELRRTLDLLETDAPLANRYAEATEARTGIECFDTWARELVASGYLHNHSRMWFASIWIFTLQLPWQLGADFFYRHLLDGDPASNTLSWRWVGGLHTKGKTYLARSSNIARFTNGRFNPAGQLAAVAPALEEDGVGASIPLRPADPFPHEQQYGLLITEEDCHPESLGLAPTALVGLTATDQRSSLATGECASAFARGAIQDAMQRAEANCGVKRSETGPTEAEDWSKHLLAFAA